METLVLSPPLFTILAGLVEERTGIHYDPRDGSLFSSKLMARALERGFESPLDYYYFLRYDDADRREFNALAETLVVNETYFYREVDQLRVLCDEMLLPLIARGREPRIWCAAAATGEEPLTLCMLLADRSLLGRVKILATDLSANALARAAEGVFGKRSLRAIPDQARARWLTGPDERAEVRRELREAITWQRLNLMDTETIQALGTFDVILCRNVLIYFEENTVRRVAMTLAGSLREDGRLLVGASESLLRFGTQLACEERGGCFFYRRPPV